MAPRDDPHRLASEIVVITWSNQRSRRSGLPTPKENDGPLQNTRVPNTDWKDRYVPFG